jgi:hypothetical protein
MGSGVRVRLSEADVKGLRFALPFLYAILVAAGVAKQAMAERDHGLEACMTSVAAQDFLLGDVLMPRGNELELAEDAGWSGCRPQRSAP